MTKWRPEGWENLSHDWLTKEIITYILSEGDYDCGHFILDVDQDDFDAHLKKWGFPD